MKNNPASAGKGRRFRLRPPLLLYSHIANELLAPFFASFLILYGVFFLIRLIPLLEVVLALRIGLGDFLINDQPGLRPPNPNGWRKRLPPYATSRIVPMVAPLMAVHGYKVPKVPPPADRETAIRGFEIAIRMKQQLADQAKAQG